METGGFFVGLDLRSLGPISGHWAGFWDPCSWGRGKLCPSCFLKVFYRLGKAAITSPLRSLFERVYSIFWQGPLHSPAIMCREWLLPVCTGWQMAKRSPSEVRDVCACAGPRAQHQVFYLCVVPSQAGGGLGTPKPDHSWISQGNGIAT